MAKQYAEYPASRLYTLACMYRSYIWLKHAYACIIMSNNVWPQLAIHKNYIWLHNYNLANYTSFIGAM